MRAITYCGFVWFLLGFMNETFADDAIVSPKFGVNLTLSETNDNFVPGDLIKINASLVNQTTEPITLTNLLDYYFFYRIYATSDGKPVPLTCRGERVYNTRTSSYYISSRAFLTDPGKSTRASQISVSFYYDFSLDGKYEVVCKVPIVESGRPLGPIGDKRYEALEMTSSAPLKISIDSTKSDVVKNFPSAGTQQISREQNGATISLTTNRESYKEYGQVLLKVGTKNTSRTDLSMYDNSTNIFDCYDITLRTPGPNRDFRRLKDKNFDFRVEIVTHGRILDDVKDVSLTLYGQKLLSEKSKTLSMVTVKPGEEVAEQIVVLNRIFDMSEDGIYGLTVSRKFTDTDGKEQTVTSDPLPIRIGTALTQDEIDQRVKEQKEREEREKKK